MGYSGAEIITRFATFAGQPHGIEPGKRGRTRERFPSGSGSSLYYATDRQGRVVEIQSYGSHFPLGLLVLGRAGKRKRWLLNGDRWPGGGWGRTNDHNDMMREMAQESKTPWFIIPFSVVREAGITMNSIVPVHVLPERWAKEEHTATRLEDVPEYLHKRRVWRDASGQEITPPAVTVHVAGAEREQEAHPDGNGGWYVQERSAIGGWHQVTVEGPAYSGHLETSWEEIEPAADGLYRYHTDRHWLGESVFRASYRTWDRKHGDRRLTRYFLSAFDHDEPGRPAYFLAEMPAGVRPKTVEEAREALKPVIVADAETDRLDVIRQGDLFAIPTAYTTRDLKAGGAYTALHGDYVLGTNHTATQVIVTPAGTFARGILRHRPAFRRPDHVNRPLGDRKTWHRLVRNTVPVDARGNSRAWSVSNARASID